MRKDVQVDQLSVSSSVGRYLSMISSSAEKESLPREGGIPCGDWSRCLRRPLECYGAILRSSKH